MGCANDFRSSPLDKQIGRQSSSMDELSRGDKIKVEEEHRSAFDFALLASTIVKDATCSSITLSRKVSIIQGLQTLVYNHAMLLQTHAKSPPYAYKVSRCNVIHISSSSASTWHVIDSKM
jgi:hypothetical protein